jgi:hypothetical protein
VDADAHADGEVAAGRAAEQGALDVRLDDELARFDVTDRGI